MLSLSRATEATRRKEAECYQNKYGNCANKWDTSSSGQITLCALSSSIARKHYETILLPSTEKMKHKTQSEFSMEEEEKKINRFNLTY
jgi:hypothetical protein